MNRGAVAVRLMTETVGVKGRLEEPEERVWAVCRQLSVGGRDSRRGGMVKT